MGHSDRPVVDRLVEREHDQVQVLEDRSFLDRVPQEQADGVVEGGQDALEHELVLVRGSDDVEGEVDRTLAQHELVRVQQNVACGTSPSALS